MHENTTMQDPLAFFITWPTYGTWLPGDRRGWTEFHHGWKLPVRELERFCRASMTERQCLLTTAERAIVVEQVAETCDHRGWELFAVDCRSNHVHVVLAAFVRTRERFVGTSKHGVLGG